ncbi:MAG TPA: prepilin-type N-terminal cleavage/methylation domain-containing protein [Syntrophales bacterium]|nr:prepilin-type N-terminal cleavage/methylation domain-containing protein [Syntrophales bacterium]
MGNKGFRLAACGLWLVARPHPTPYTLHPSSKRGFTLVEILVAIAILAVVLSTIYASYISTMRVVKSLEYGDEVYSMARITLERMVMDLQSACKEKDAYEFVTLKDSTGRLPMKGVSFLSRAHVDFSGPGGTLAVAQIRYELEGDIDSGGFSIVRRDILRQGEGASGAEGFILCRRLQFVNLRFYDSTGREYSTWDSSGGTEAQRNKVPSAVLIELNFINPDDAATPYKFMTRLLLTGEVKT